MADAAEGPPTKHQRLTEELEQSEDGRHVLETVSCSICTEVFEDPVSPRGSVHTYCRACIRQALAVQPRCPLSNARIAIRRGNIDAVLDGNHQVRSMIESQPVTCKYASHGCTARPALESIDAHEATCPHKPVVCSHERCRFVGSRAETAAHEKVCPFVLLGPVLDAQAAEIRSLQGEVRDAKRRLTAEHEASERLKARLEALEAARPAVVSPARRRASEDDVREARALFDEGIRHRENKRWPEAIAAFQKCVALDANHSEAWFALGMAYYNRNGMKNCEAEYEPYTRCIALDPKHASAHNNLGQVLRTVRKDYDGAERHYRKAIELAPTAAKYTNLGALLKNVRKDYDGAENMYRKAIELNPKLTAAHWNLSCILENQRNDVPGAVELMEEYVRLGGVPGFDGEQRLATLRRKLGAVHSP
jgi:tetratricopeptide (TPR) repeat protein